MVGSGRRHRAAGPIPEGRPSGPRPSAVSRTTGSEAPRWPDLRAAAPCRRPLRWGPARFFFVLAAAFGWFRLAGLLACSLACLFACFQRFSRPRSFAHSEHQPKECYMESRQQSVPRAQPARTASRPARLEAALASPQRARTKGVRQQPAPPRPGA